MFLGQKDSGFSRMLPLLFKTTDRCSIYTGSFQEQVVAVDYDHSALCLEIGLQAYDLLVRHCRISIYRTEEVT